MRGDFPVIDIAAVRQSNQSAAARREIARRLASACEEIGFFAVTRHGVPGAVIADLVAQSHAFAFAEDARKRNSGSTTTRDPAGTSWVPRRSYRAMYSHNALRNVRFMRRRPRDSCSPSGSSATPW
jgi:isopenicillin N synthase-like dioxygenase